MNAESPIARIEPAPVPLGARQSQSPLLTLRDIRKSFAAVRALRGVNLDVRSGEVHAIVGENGAGKSTLIAVAAGVIQADAGHFACNGVRVDDPTVAKMRDLGVAVVYQHHSLVPDLTVLENLKLSDARLQGADGSGRAESLIRDIAGDARKIPLSRRVCDLTLAEAHVVEIARALASNPRIIFFDEPTEPFQEADVERLFRLIGELRKKQLAVVYVSHRLHEVAAIADRISVMRDGEIIDSRPADAISGGEIITLIAGRPLDELFPGKCERPGGTVLKVLDLHGTGFESVDLTVSAGEIVGLAGIEGEGQRAFMRCVAGVERRRAGSVIVNGNIVPPGAKAARNARIEFISDDRHAESLFMPLTVRENLGIGAQHRFARNGIVQQAREAELTKALATELRIKAPSVETAVTNLSGGNQQKVVIGRALSAAPRVLLIDEPTKGVDIGSRAEIYQKLRALADNGMAIAVSSSDGIELEGLCDRVLIFARGRVVRELTGTDVNDASITEANLTANASRSDEANTDWRDGGLRRSLSSDHFPAFVLAGSIALLLAVMSFVEPLFMSQYNLASVMTFIALLGLISIGQFLAVLVGGIDLSVGALAGFAVVLASFLMPTDASTAHLIGGAFAIILAGTIIGLVHGGLVTFFGLPAIIVTLASLIGLQGLSLILRPTPGGMITFAISDAVSFLIGGIPAGILAVCLVVVLLEVMLFQYGVGRRLRAVGSRAEASQRVGVNVNLYTFGAYAASGIFAAIGGLLLAGQIGIGSAGIGLDYTIMSITAVVLGGASISGGRGSMICTLLGAALVQLASSVSSFLNSDSSVHYAILGGVTLVAAIFFSVVRSRSLGP